MFSGSGSRSDGRAALKACPPVHVERGDTCAQQVIARNPAIYGNTLAAAGQQWARRTPASPFAP